MATQQRHLPDPVPPSYCVAGEGMRAAHSWAPLREEDFYCTQCLHRLEGRYVADWQQRVARMPNSGTEPSVLTVETAELAAGALALTPIERRLLVRLASEPDSVIGYAEIAETLWGIEGADVHDRAALRQHVAALRRKLCALRAEISTVASVGYRFKFADAREVVAD